MRHQPSEDSDVLNTSNEWNNSHGQNWLKDHFPGHGVRSKKAATDQEFPELWTQSQQFSETFEVYISCYKRKLLRSEQLTPEKIRGNNTEGYTKPVLSNPCGTPHITQVIC